MLSVVWEPINETFRGFSWGPEELICVYPKEI